MRREEWEGGRQVNRKARKSGERKSLFFFRLQHHLGGDSNRKVGGREGGQSVLTIQVTSTIFSDYYYDIVFLHKKLKS